MIKISSYLFSSVKFTCSSAIFIILKCLRTNVLGAFLTYWRLLLQFHTFNYFGILLAIIDKIFLRFKIKEFSLSKRHSCLFSLFVCILCTSIYLETTKSFSILETWISEKQVHVGGPLIRHPLICFMSLLLIQNTFSLVNFINYFLNLDFLQSDITFSRA